MTPLIYALNIGTMAAWLTVAGAGTVAYAVPMVYGGLPELISMGSLDDMDTAAVVDLGEMSQGSAPPADPTQEPTDEENAPQEQIAAEELPEAPEEELPEVPEIAELEPLPEIPDFPAPAPVKPAAPKAESAPKPRPTVARRAAGNAKENVSGRSRASSNGQGGAGSGTGTGNVSGGGSSQMGAARFAGGRKPNPRYPSSAKSAGQQGRVVIFFTVDERGNVINASIRSGTPYPALNEEALRCIRTWKFSPGARASATKPIVFRLN